MHTHLPRIIHTYIVCLYDVHVSVSIYMFLCVLMCESACVHVCVSVCEHNSSYFTYSLSGFI